MTCKGFSGSTSIEQMNREQHSQGKIDLGVTIWTRYQPIAFKETNSKSITCPMPLYSKVRASCDLWVRLSTRAVLRSTDWRVAHTTHQLPLQLPRTLPHCCYLPRPYHQTRLHQPRFPGELITQTCRRWGGRSLHWLHWRLCVKHKALSLAQWALTSAYTGTIPQADVMRYDAELGSLKAKGPAAGPSVIGTLADEIEDSSVACEVQNLSRVTGSLGAGD
jgi:hypothetical protein